MRRRRSGFHDPSLRVTEVSLKDVYLPCVAAGSVRCAFDLDIRTVRSLITHVVIVGAASLHCVAAGSVKCAVIKILWISGKSPSCTTKFLFYSSDHVILS